MAAPWPAERLVPVGAVALLDSGVAAARQVKITGARYWPLCRGALGGQRGVAGLPSGAQGVMGSGRGPFDACPE